MKYDLIERLRQDRGNYPSVAEATGIKLATIRKITSGATKNPYGRTMRALAEYYAKIDGKR